MTRRKKFLIGFVVLIILGALCNKQVPYESETQAVDTINTIMIGDKRTTKINSWWAKNREDLDILTGYFQNKDYSAVSKLMTLNRIFKIKESQTIFITDIKIWDGYVKIRPIGKTFEVWTHINSIEDAQ